MNGHKAVQCDSCEMWIHNECLYISHCEYETLEKIQTPPGYAQNVKYSTSLILILILSATLNSQTGLIPW